MPADEDETSEGLLFLEGAGAPGFGGGSTLVERFDSSSTAGGVETGVVGGLLTIGLLPPHPAAMARKVIIPRLKKGRIGPQKLPPALRSTIELKKRPSTILF